MRTSEEPIGPMYLPRARPLDLSKHYVIHHGEEAGVLYVFGSLGVALNPWGKLLNVGLAIASEGTRGNHELIALAR